jgi:hypothetical protein
MDCVKEDMRIKGVSMEMTSDRREWKKKTCCADPTWCNKGTTIMIISNDTFHKEFVQNYTSIFITYSWL